MSQSIPSGTYQVDNANLENSTFNNVKLEGASFINVNLKQSTFEDIAFTGTTIRNACMKDVSIEDANLTGMRIFGILVADMLQAYHDAQSKS